MVAMNEIDTLLIIQARTSSRRLPGKVLIPVNGKPILEWQTLRILQTASIDQVIMATSIESSDDEVEAIANRCGIKTVRGSLENVFSRFIKALDIYNPKIVIRITGDCPLYMPKLCEAMLKEFERSNVEYLSNTLTPTYPDGCDIEIFSSGVIRELEKIHLTLSELEHVTLGIYQRNQYFNCKNFSNKQDESAHRWTLDTSTDLEFVREVYREFKGRETNFGYEDVMCFLRDNPELARYDDGTMRNGELRNV
jgi:spore coat polysaccharide biosynthesis protein SpsF (cytidylyltransferase family)